jgi:hypothetical protein
MPVFGLMPRLCVPMANKNRKYPKLTAKLNEAFNNAAVQELTCSFDELDKLLRLPSGAKTANWWANSSLPHQKAWNEAGCHVHATSPRGAGETVQSITFRRGRTDHGKAFNAALSSDAGMAQEALLCLRLEWRWKKLGSIARMTSSEHPEAKRLLTFPEPPDGGGIYCFRFTLDSKEHSYVGKADNFRKRLVEYRSAKGKTEQHVERELQRALAAGGVPTLWTASASKGQLGDTDAWDIQTNDHLELVLLEHAAIASEKRAKRQVINRVRTSESAKILISAVPADAPPATERMLAAASAGSAAQGEDRSAA